MASVPRLASRSSSAISLSCVRARAEIGDGAVKLRGKVRFRAADAHDKTVEIAAALARAPSTSKTRALKRSKRACIYRHLRRELFAEIRGLFAGELFAGVRRSATPRKMASASLMRAGRSELNSSSERVCVSSAAARRSASSRACRLRRGNARCSRRSVPKLLQGRRRRFRRADKAGFLRPGRIGKLLAVVQSAFNGARDEARVVFDFAEHAR
jgi:hypothetical protein